MTVMEQRFMETIPVRLRGIEDGMKAITPRLVKVTRCAWINATDVSSVCALPESEHDNRNGGRVNISMRNGDVFETVFRTAEDAFKALGMSVG